MTSILVRLKGQGGHPGSGGGPPRYRDQVPGASYRIHATKCLELLAQGHANKTVAAKLGISTRTAEHHRANIMEKMGARSLSQLLKMALRLLG